MRPRRRRRSSRRTPRHCRSRTWPPRRSDRRRSSGCISSTPMLMPLVEVIRADTTSDATLQAAVELAKSLGKTVVVVKKDVPGFITTRVLGPYFEQAAWIHEREAVPIETIDASMRFRAGFRMGPFELADQVGVDVLHHLTENANRPMPRSVQDLVDRKKLGHKVGEGFYAYKEGRPKLTPEMGEAFDPIRILAP